MAGNDVSIQGGARIHMDEGDLLVTASNFAFGPAPRVSCPACLPCPVLFAAQWASKVCLCACLLACLFVCLFVCFP